MDGQGRLFGQGGEKLQLLSGNAGAGLRAVGVNQRDAGLVENDGQQHHGAWLQQLPAPVRHATLIFRRIDIKHHVFATVAHGIVENIGLGG